MKTLEPAQRLVVAADFKPIAPNGRDWARAEVYRLAESLRGTGVTIKVNSILRACGYDMIGVLHANGLRVFADLKLDDISETLSTDGALLQEFKPELLTAKCTAGEKALIALSDALPDTEVLGVTFLTSQTLEDAISIYNCTPEDVVRRLAKVAVAADIGGLVASPAEAQMLRAIVGDRSINTPAIRPSWSLVEGDDQNPDRVMTPAKAIAAGADRIIVGRPIVKAESPYDAAMRTIEEIASVLG